MNIVKRYNDLNIVFTGFAVINNIITEWGTAYKGDTEYKLQYPCRGMYEAKLKGDNSISMLLNEVTGVVKFSAPINSTSSIVVVYIKE